jgi:hypothetical protein
MHLRIPMSVVHTSVERFDAGGILMPITADVRSGQCKICQQGATNHIPVLVLEQATGMLLWQVAVCRRCAAELRQHLDEYLSPQDS